MRTKIPEQNGGENKGRRGDPVVGDTRYAPRRVADSASPDEFAVRASGGVRFVAGVDASGNPISGPRLAPGVRARQELCDRTPTENIAPVNGQQAFIHLALIPISTFDYKSQDPAIRHLGPMAHDFARLRLGRNDEFVYEVDPCGVALAPIRRLNQIASQQEAKIGVLETAYAPQ